MKGSQARLVEDARRLAEPLLAASPPVTRNVWLSLVSGYLAGGGREELAHLLDLFEISSTEGDRSGGHRERSGSYGEQVVAAAATLRADLTRTELGDPAYRTVLGWVGRLLEIAEAERKPERAKGRGTKTVRPGPQPGESRYQKETSQREEKRPRSGRDGRMGALSSRSRSVLEEMQDRLREGESTPDKDS